jgi:hypothetical protein
MAGYFVCGFQVVFIGVHMPSYLKDKGLSPQVASYALALIGLFNVFGTYIAGTLGQKLAKRKILASIYFGRSIAIALFLWAPLSPLSVYVFAAVMGVLWLSTVPPTNATIAQIFGVAHLSMLGGFVFFSHQIGSFAMGGVAGRPAVRPHRAATTSSGTSRSRWAGAVRRPARRAGRPGTCRCAACAGLRVVAYEDGFLPSPDRFVQRIAAVRSPAGLGGSPERHPLGGPAPGQ